jgi:hypothetical protein
MTWLLLLKRYWKALAVAALLAGVYWWGHNNGAAGVQVKFDAHLAQDAIAAQKASEAARKHEQQDAKASAKIADAYEQGKRDAEAAGKRVADDLRSGNAKLRKRWQGCQATDRVSGAATRAAESDAEAADRAESAGRIVRAAREADEQINGLQDILRAERR